MNQPVPHPQTQPQAFLRHLFDIAVARAQPAHGLPPHLPPPPRGRTLVLGAGKAAGAMAQALEAAEKETWGAEAKMLFDFVRDARKRGICDYVGKGSVEDE